MLRHILLVCALACLLLVTAGAAGEFSRSVLCLLVDDLMIGCRPPNTCHCVQASAVLPVPRAALRPMGVCVGR